MGVVYRVRLGRVRVLFLLVFSARLSVITVNECVLPLPVGIAHFLQRLAPVSDGDEFVGAGLADIAATSIRWQAVAMQIEILCNGQIIGSVNVLRLDPPMGVAVGVFKPAASYKRQCHATRIDDRDNSSVKAGQLSARVSGGEFIECLAISVEDWHEIGEIEVTIFGIAYPAYETYFGDHPDYKEYNCPT